MELEVLIMEEKSRRKGRFNIVDIVVVLMLLAGADSIREVIAFPKNKDAADLMSGAPDVVDPVQLTDLHIAVEE